MSGDGIQAAAPVRRLIFVGAVEDQALFSCMFAVWRTQGCVVEIWAEMSEQTYRNARGFIGRAWMRVRINMVFPLRVGLRLLFGTQGGGRMLVVTSTPFTLPAVAGLMKRRGDRVCQMLYDLYPDALVVAGKFGPRSLVSRMIASLVRTGMQRCDLTVFPGERLRAYTDRTYGPCPRTAVLPVGTDAGHLGVKRLPLSEATRRIVYVGNFGHLHDYHTLAEMLRVGLPLGVQIDFHANGANYERFKACAGDWSEDTRRRVAFGGPLPRGEWARVMKEADVGLVLFKDGAERVAFPSKTFSAMAAGQAILAVSPLVSDLADVVRDHGCGWVSAPGDVEGLRRNLETIAGDRAALSGCQTAAAEAAREHYDVVRLAGRWLELFERLAPSPGGKERGIAMLTPVKYLGERIVAVFGLVLISPLLLGLALLVKCTSPGPVLYVTDRLGLGGRVFRLYKFRSMRVNAPQITAADGKVLTQKRDPRLTPIGAFLRLGFDELPQLFNILCGDMTMVGPRPDVPWELERYSPRERRRLEALPGITGLAQVVGGRDLNNAQNYELDVRYVEQMSWWTDFLILLVTVPYSFGAKNVGLRLFKQHVDGIEKLSG